MSYSTATRSDPGAFPPVEVRKRPPVWPVIPLALPAAVSIWGGWVGLGQLTGFGVVQLLPGIWDGLRLNTAVTLPIGMEAYASYALCVWLHRGTPQRARDFARVSSIVALTLGAFGQVAYHLMAASGVTSAPWPVTAAVACLPVAVLGMGATLAHLLTVDDPTPVAPAIAPVVPVRPVEPIRPTAPVRPDPLPEPVTVVRPEFVPAVRPADRPAERPASATRPDPAPRPVAKQPERPTRSTRNGPARKPRTDAQLSRAVRDIAEQNGGPPSVYQLKQRFGIGSSRAARLIAGLDPVPAGSPASNGHAARVGGAA